MLRSGILITVVEGKGGRSIGQVEEGTPARACRTGAVLSCLKCENKAEEELVPVSPGEEECLGVAGKMRRRFGGRMPAGQMSEVRRVVGSVGSSAQCPSLAASCRLPTLAGLLCTLGAVLSVTGDLDAGALVAADGTTRRSAPGGVLAASGSGGRQEKARPWRWRVSGPPFRRGTALPFPPQPVRDPTMP